MEWLLGGLGAWMDKRAVDTFAVANTTRNIFAEAADKSQLGPVVSSFFWRFVLSTGTIIVLVALTLAIGLGILTCLKLPNALSWLWSQITWLWGWLTIVLRVILGIVVGVATLSGVLWFALGNYNAIDSLLHWNASLEQSVSL